MRYIATFSLILSLSCAALGWARPPALFSDPVFGMTYDSRLVHFETAPKRVSQACPDLHGQQFWLYAYHKTGNLEYFVLSNRQSEDSGAGVILRGAECIEGLPDWLLSGDAKYHPSKVNDGQGLFSEPALHSLSSDLLRRYAAAFGGKRNFLEAVKKKGLPLQDLVPILRTELVKFSNAR